MKIDDHRRVSSLSIALVLLAVYGLYVPHLFLTVTAIEHGALGGPVNGLLYVTGMGMLFMLTLPVYGDLFFWIASVLFARRRFHGAVIVGGIGLGLCASFYCFPLIAWDLHRETANGAPARSHFGWGVWVCWSASRGSTCTWRTTMPHPTPMWPTVARRRRMVIKFNCILRRFPPNL